MNYRSAHSLDWFPKEFRRGDEDGSSTGNRIGRTALSRLEVLVRETAQNAWDARLDGQRPTFGLNLRRVDEKLRDIILTLLHNDQANTPLPVVLRHADARVLEIFDRGTCGLDGPIDMSPGEPKNFQDLIFKVGVPRVDGKGGGTFGYGKDATYHYSEVRTVIFWTRCRNSEGIIEDRFIVSANRDSYIDNDVQYTGRQWWGEVREVEKGSTREEEVFPVVGEDATALGEMLFERHFEPGQTGTSLLIIAPRIAGEREDEESLPAVQQTQRSETQDVRYEEERDWADRTRNAIRKHLWPKLVSEPDSGLPPMQLELQIDSRQVPLVSDHDGTLSTWGDLLNAIRIQRSGGTPLSRTAEGMKIEVIEIRRQRPALLLGHLAFALRIPSLEPGSDGFDDLDPAVESNDNHRLVLMRDAAELVVTTKNWGPRCAVPGTDWLAVFKSAQESDPIFAASEPATHDDWIPHGANDDNVRLVVNYFKTRTRAALKHLVGSANSESSLDDRVVLPLSALSSRLGRLIPATYDVSTTTRDNKPSDRSRRPSRAVHHRLVQSPARLVSTHSDGTQVQEIDFHVEGHGGGNATVEISASIIGDDNTRDTINADRLYPRWSEPAQSISTQSALVPVGRPIVVTVQGPRRRAMRITLSLTK